MLTSWSCSTNGHREQLKEKASCFGSRRAQANHQSCAMLSSCLPMRFACGHLHGCMKRKEEQEHPSKTGSIVPPLSPSLSLSLFVKRLNQPVLMTLGWRKGATDFSYIIVYDVSIDQFTSTILLCSIQHE